MRDADAQAGGRVHIARTRRLRGVGRAVGIVGLLLALGGCGPARDGAAPRVAASNTLLECAVQDVMGAPVPVLRLAEPGMCPGHFDVRPSQIEALRHSTLLFRLDFQKGLDARLAAVGPGLRIVEVGLPGGLAEPASYLAACRQVAQALVASGVLERNRADEALERIEARIERRVLAVRTRLAPLEGWPVVASAHQARFCRWAGLEVVVAFTAADAAAVGAVDAAVRAGVEAGARAVIANRPEGRRMADAMADRLGAPVAVLDNFPAPGEGHAPWDDLLEGNVEALRRALLP
jgi:zinc transport system substrate-binding protein